MRIPDAAARCAALEFLARTATSGARAGWDSSDGTLPGSPEILYALLGGISRSLPAPPILALEAGAARTAQCLLPPLPTPRRSRKGSAARSSSERTARRGVKNFWDSIPALRPRSTSRQGPVRSHWARALQRGPSRGAECGAFLCRRTLAAQNPGVRKAFPRPRQCATYCPE